MKPLVAPNNNVGGNGEGGRRRRPGGGWQAAGQQVPTTRGGGEERRGINLRHAGKLAFGIVVSVALASSALRYHTGHGLVVGGVELSVVGPSVETIEEIKAFSLASFLEVEDSHRRVLSGGNIQDDDADIEEEIEKEDARADAAAAPAGIAPAVTTSVVGSQVDMEEALARTKAKIAEERAEAERGGVKKKKEEKRKEEEARRKEKEEEEVRKKKEKEKKEEEEEEKKEQEKKKKKEAATSKAPDAPKVDKPDPAEEKAEEEDSTTKDEDLEEEVEEEAKEEEEEEDETEKEQEEPPPVQRPDESDEVKEERMRRHFAEEKAKAIAWPTAEDLLLKPSADTETGVVVPFHPSKGVIRKPITTQPPLHRPWEEVEVEKVLVFLSSSDRGERVSHLWAHGDKMDTIEVTLASLVSWCERGFDVTLWFMAAWKVSEEDARIKKALQCERIAGPVEVRYWDHYPPKVEGYLSSKHRVALAEAKDEFDFFISIEDDMHLRPVMLDAFLENSGRLARVDKPYLDTFFPGFVRIEHDPVADQRWATWETDADDYEGMFLGKEAGWWGLVGGNR